MIRTMATRRQTDKAMAGNHESAGVAVITRSLTVFPARTDDVDVDWNDNTLGVTEKDDAISCPVLGSLESINFRCGKLRHALKYPAHVRDHGYQRRCNIALLYGLYFYDGYTQ